ncbi:MAG: hypothetical protein GY821_00975, partial [Gammaproteobacteria bacterium]|nr:hypothetical protein [Gammaproteobacteria bacterium]
MTYNQNIKPTSLPLGGLCWRYDYLEILEKAMRATIILVFILISPTVLAEKESIPKDRTITELVVYE